MPPRQRRLTREESKARTRADLLKAANRLFLRNGFVATSLADIAKEAALTKGAVYSNFDGKEELFLALLEEERSDGKHFANQEQLAPSDLSKASGDDAFDRARSWGDHLAGLRPSVRHVALFLEMNAFALRNERTRSWAAEHNRRFFTELGAGLAELFEVPDADHETLGLIAQSLYVGLEMHGAFSGRGVDEAVFRRAYEMLVHVARASAADPA